MKRTTITLPEDLADRATREARRRETSVSDLVREALAQYLAVDTSRPRHLPFAALGRSGHSDTSERIDELLAEEYPAWIARAGSC